MLALVFVVAAGLTAVLDGPPAAPGTISAPSGLHGFLAAMGTTDVDQETAALTNGQHYLASNERDLHLIEADVRGRGGVLVAVGADPGYVLAAWADADALVFVDLDRAIPDLHQIYAAFFAEAATPGAFLRLWSEAGRAEALALLRSIADSDEDATALVEIYEAALPGTSRHFSDLAKRMTAAGVPWLLSEDSLYQRTRALVRGGKVIALRGDFTRGGVVRALGERLREHKQEVGLLYLSNIEQYFLYGPEFRANIAALPFASDGIALRTLPGRPAGFEYIVEDGDHFQERVADPRVRSVYRIRGFQRGDHLVGRTRHRIAPSRTSVP